MDQQTQARRSDKELINKKSCQLIDFAGESQNENERKKKDTKILGLC